jgi:electron transport complex protein RnfB
MSCPNNAIRFNGNQRLIDYKKCSGCLTCVNVCPRNAITVTSAEEEDVISVDVAYHKCDNCAICFEICPNNLYEEYEYAELNGSTKMVHRVPPTKFFECSGCGVCVESCPENAIQVQKLSSKK